MTDTTLEPTSPAPQSETREPQTGLLRRLGLFDILAMTVLAVSLVFTGWLPFSTLAGRFPTASLNILIGIGLVFVLIHTFTFSAMGAVFPWICGIMDSDAVPGNFGRRVGSMGSADSLASVNSIVGFLAKQFRVHSSRNIHHRAGDDGIDISSHPCSGICPGDG